MADRGGEGDAAALVKEGLEHEDVRQVHAAIERIVHNEDVAGVHVVAEMAQNRKDRRWNRAEMGGQSEPLGD